VFAELRRVIGGSDPIGGLAMMEQIAITEVVLGELHALHGVSQSRFHHLDVYDHTIEVLRGVLQMQRDPASMISEDHATELTQILREPLADELTRGDALRWGALLHDAAKPHTRAVAADGRVTFIGHDQRGAELARELLGRLRTSTKLSSHVAELVANHLRLGFLTHEPQPLARETVYEYLRTCGAVAVDVTLLSVADRLATRGDRAAEAIGAHTRLAGELLTDALRWRSQGPAPPLLRGDELLWELGIAPGPLVGEVLEQLARAQYAGKISSRSQALDQARAFAHERTDA
jgi:poly(A) polymerase